jgi:cytochrome c oxidase assembly protein subunit 11
MSTQQQQHQSATGKADAGKAAAAQKLRNLPMLGKLAIFALMMFGFGWGMIPLYNAICEVTGINNLTRRDESAAEFARSTQVDTSRQVVIEFDTNMHGLWRFKPAVHSISVHPGELATVEYELVNTADETKSGQAIPSYAPEIGGRYFRKLECFCFQQQTLEGKEVRRFPVVFVIDPKLPDEVTTITLSYTFFDVAGQFGKAPATGSVAAKGRT